MAPDPDSIGDWLSSSSSDPREVAERYDAWAAAYDGDLASWSYRAPAVVARTVRTHLPDADSVLDVGCGTGLAGRELRAAGFTGRLHGLDISAASRAIAEQSDVYDTTEQADLQQRLPLDVDSVDAAVCVGVMTYLPDVEAIWRELARVVRPGGLVVVTQRDDLWRDRDCQAVVDRLEAGGVWTPVDLTGPAPYLPEGYGDGDDVACYYFTGQIS